MQFELSRLSTYDRESMLAELRRVSELVPVELPLTGARFNEFSRVNASTIKRRFGGWKAALEAAGIADRYSGRTVSSKMHSQSAKLMSDDELIGELQRVAATLEIDCLAQPQFNDSSAISASAVVRRFGSWNAALRLAGLQPVRMGRRYSQEEYFENLLEVWTHYGRQPLYADMDRPPSKITAGGYERRFGSWSKALVAFVDRMNSGDADTVAPALEPAAIPAKAVPTPVEDRRKIPLSLRYAVLRRDSFKCTVCGNSPAVDPTCILHVDHVVPFSRGGRTVESNLRATCAACNIGKSAGV